MPRDDRWPISRGDQQPQLFTLAIAEVNWLYLALAPHDLEAIDWRSRKSIRCRPKYRRDRESVYLDR